MKKFIVQKTMVLCAFLVILTASVPLGSAQPKELPKKGSLFGMQFVLHMTYGQELQTPVHSNEVRMVDVDINCAVVRGAFGRLVLLLLEGRPATITFSISDKSEWCTAWVSHTNTSITIQPDAIQTVSNFVHLFLNEDAPLNHSVGFVTVHAAIGDYKGPFNLLTLIQGYQQDMTIPFVTSPNE